MPDLSADEITALVAAARSRMDGMDQQLTDDYAAMKITHPNLDNYLPRVEVSNMGAECECCDHPGVRIPMLDTLKLADCCRESVNCVVHRSLCHTSGDATNKTDIRYQREICYKCDIKYDRWGFVNGALHHSMDIDDTIGVGPDGLPETRLGMKSLLLSGVITIDLSDGSLSFN